MKNRRIFFILVLTMTIFTSFSQTYVSGGIFSDTTWYASNSPYIVIGDVAIYPGNTLVVEEGTEVKFDSGHRLIVRGLLELQGTENENIIFTSNVQSPNIGDWTGIEIENDQGGKIIGSYVQGSFADYFIKIQSSSSGEVLNLSNSKISNCNFAFFGYDGSSNFTVNLLNDTIIDNSYGYIYGQNLTVNNCKFSNGEKGIHGWEGPDITIKNSEFSNFSIWPFNLQGLIDSCHIHNNAVGIRMKPSLVVRNCLIELNEVGIAAEYPYQVLGENIYNNKICNNTTYNFEHLYSYPINIPNNNWCSCNEEEIGLTIYDAYDDVSLGIVTFTPFNCDSTTTNIKDVRDEKQQVSFYPNPTNNYIQLYSDKNIIYEIYSTNGILLLKGVSNRKIDVSSLVKGIYIIKTIDTISESGYKTKTTKLIKQ